MYSIVLMVGGTQNLKTVAAVSTSLCLTNFILFLVSQDKAIAQASCTFSWSNWFKNCHIRKLIYVSSNLLIWNWFLPLSILIGRVSIKIS